MKLIMQTGHPDACGHCCVAMVAGVTLDKVFEMARGDSYLGEMMIRELLRQLGCPTPDGSYLIEAFGNRTIAALQRKHPTMILSVFSCIDPQYSHAVVLHKGDLYDPWSGMNPQWPWHRYIAIARAVERNGGGGIP